MELLLVELPSAALTTAQAKNFIWNDANMSDGWKASRDSGNDAGELDVNGASKAYQPCQPPEMMLARPPLN